MEHFEFFFQHFLIFFDQSSNDAKEEPFKKFMASISYMEIIFLFNCSGFFFAHCGWLLCRKHPEVIAKGKGLDLTDLENDPILHFQRK